MTGMIRISELYSRDPLMTWALNRRRQSLVAEDWEEEIDSFVGFLCARMALTSNAH